MSDKRQNYRVDFNVEAELELENEPPRPGRLQNISRSGTFIQISPLPPFGQKAMLRVRLPGIPDPCEIPCIVRWTKEDSGAGLQFENLRPIEVWALNKIMRKK